MPDTPDTPTPGRIGAMFSGFAGAVSANMRQSLWEAYSANSTRMSGVPDPVLLIARNLRSQGVVFNDQQSFNAFLDDYGQSTAGKGGVDRIEALQDLVSRHMLANSADALDSAMGESGTSKVSESVSAAAEQVQPPAAPPSTAMVPYSGGGGMAAGGGGDGGSGGGGGGLVPSGGGGGGDSRSILEQIRDAVRMLLIVTIKNSEGNAGKTNEPKEDPANEKAKEEKRPAFWDIISGGMDEPTTNIGKFGHRVGKRVKKLFGTFKQLGKYAKPKASRASVPAGGSAARAAVPAAEGAAGAEGAGVAAGAAAGGPVGIGVAAAVVFGTFVLEFGKSVYAFGRAQEAEMRRLAQVGGAQAAAVAQLDAHRVGRDVKTASETGGSASSLAASLDKFEDKLRPMESLITNISNTVAGRMLDMLSGALDVLNVGIRIITEIYNVLPWGDKIEEPQPMWDIMKDIEKKTLEHGKPKWPTTGGAGPRGGSTPSTI